MQEELKQIPNQACGHMLIALRKMLVLGIIAPPYYAMVSMLSLQLLSA